MARMASDSRRISGLTGQAMNVMKKPGIAIFGAFLLALGFAGGAAARTLDGSLKHVMSFELPIVELDVDSAARGIAEGWLVKAVRAATRGARFDLKGDDYTLYVRISTLPRDGICFSPIDMEAYYDGELPLPNYPKGNHAKSRHGKTVRS